MSHRMIGKRYFTNLDILARIHNEKAHKEYNYQERILRRLDRRAVLKLQKIMRER